MTLEERIQELEQSHDELRAALVAAGWSIRKSRPTPEKAKLLSRLRIAVRDAREIRHKKISPISAN